MVCQKGIVAMQEHELQEIPHEWLYLYMGITENLIAVSEANQFDDVSV